MRHLIILLLLISVFYSCCEKKPKRQQIRRGYKKEIVKPVTPIKSVLITQPSKVFSTTGYNIIKINNRDALVINEHLTIKYKLSADKGIIYSLYKNGKYISIYTYHSDNSSIQDVIDKLTITLDSKDQPFKFK